MKAKQVFTKLGAEATKSFAIISAKTKKHSPEILLVTGVVGVVVAAVMACKATTKVSEILEETQNELDAIHRVKEDPNKDYTEDDAKKDLVIVYAQTGFKFIKLYGPSVALGVLSITGILTSNNILRKRNATLVAAYTALDKGFREYRSRVVERFGEKVDKELRYNIRAKKIEETVTDENGKEKKVKKTIDVADPNLPSPYAMFFDESSSAWEKDAEANKFFLTSRQNYFTDILRTRGFLFLNEVYKELGLPVTRAGQMVGWIYRPNDTNYHGDGYVDLGIYDITRPKARDFINGYERSILIDPNVDGYILDHIK